MIYIVMLGFNKTEVIHKAFQNFTKTTYGQELGDVKKVFFNVFYPGNKRIDLMNLCVDFDWTYIEMENESVVENHNRAIHDILRIKDSDLYVTFDPDVEMLDGGWITAFRRAIKSKDRIAYVAAARPFHNEEWCWKGAGRSIYDYDGIRCATWNNLIAWSMGCYNGAYLVTRPRVFKAYNRIYGYGEHADLDFMRENGWEWITLVDHRDNHGAGQDESYLEWKVQSAQGKTELKYEDWLKNESATKYPES